MRFSLRGPAAGRVVAPVVLALLAPVLTACEVDQSVVHVLLADDTGPRWSAVGLPAFEERVAERCEGCVVKVSSAGGDAAKQADQFARVVEEDADVVVLDAVDPEAAEGYVSKAGDVPVVTWDRPVAGADYFVGVEPGSVGQVLAAAVRRQPPGRVLVLDAPPGDTDAAEVVAEARGGISSAQDVVAPVGTAETRRLVGQRVGGTAYAAVLASTDEQAAGAAAALAGREGGPAVVGPDAWLSTARRIVAGSQDAAAYVPWHHVGTRVADVVVPLMTGGRPRGGEDVDGVQSWTVEPQQVTIDTLTGTMVRDGAVDLDRLCAGRVRARCTTLGLL
jgi:ABC-type xylose transport system substrate-binding protein